MHYTLQSISIPLCLLLLLAPSLSAQKCLQLEKKGSLNTQKFCVGEALTFRLAETERYWHRETIVDIYVDDQLIEFANRTVHLKDITAIRTGSKTGFVRSLSVASTYFSATWTFWTLVSLAYGETLTLPTVAIGAGAFALGRLLKIFFFKTHRIKGRKRLRLIDLTFYRIPVQSYSHRLKQSMLKPDDIPLGLVRLCSPLLWQPYSFFHDTTHEHEYWKCALLQSVQERQQAHQTVPQKYG